MWGLFGSVGEQQPERPAVGFLSPNRGPVGPWPSWHRCNAVPACSGCSVWGTPYSRPCLCTSASLLCSTTGAAPLILLCAHIVSRPWFCVAVRFAWNLTILQHIVQLGSTFYIPAEGEVHRDLSCSPPPPCRSLMTLLATLWQRPTP